ncbi:hypothetical protein Pla123a_28900 [Posidoniimonas polymericola]|uniref:Uncharacterized protein n=1 Tax=Posidoniimonas polymericola TaxID=2528002 RepID=A0A5C5YMA4_9BACT|nr:hypothetical protein [Posidoniimonas polymericola]TWT76101.1 hypothetical protein Pla123a_28900 [Posidoniimonas polymericola]
MSETRGQLSSIIAAEQKLWAPHRAALNAMRGERSDSPVEVAEWLWKWWGMSAELSGVHAWLSEEETEAWRLHMEQNPHHQMHPWLETAERACTWLVARGIDAAPLSDLSFYLARLIEPHETDDRGLLELSLAKVQNRVALLVIPAVEALIDEEHSAGDDESNSSGKIGNEVRMSRPMSLAEAGGLLGCRDSKKAAYVHLLMRDGTVRGHAKNRQKWVFELDSIDIAVRHQFEINSASSP